MNFTSTSDLETKSFSELSIFDGIGLNFKKNLDVHLAQGNIEENKGDSLFVESVVIHNDINLEEELNNIRDDDEGAFKILSMSFYDKKTRAAPQRPPSQLEENNKVFTLRPKSKTPMHMDPPSKTGSHPSLTPYVNELNAHKIKDTKLGSPKADLKTEVKLFSIKERVSRLNLSPQRPNLCLSLLVTPNDNSHSQASVKEALRRNKELIKPQKPASPRRESLSRDPSTEKKPTPLDLNKKNSAMVKSKTPTYAVKKSSSKERIFASPPRITFNVSPKGFRFHPRMESSAEKARISRETSENKLPPNRKNETEESPLRSHSPVAAFSLNKSVLARRFDLHRVSLNNINYAPNKEGQSVQGKESKTPSRIIQKVSETSIQQPAQPQPQSQPQLQLQPQQQPQPIKFELAKGYRSNPSFFNKIGSRRGSNFEQKNSKLLLNQKLRINTEENSTLKISIRDISDSSIHLQGPRSVKGKMKMLDFSSVSSVKQRDIAGFSSGKDMFDPVKLSLKSQSKSKARDNKDITNKEANTSKQKNPVLPLQSRTFDI